MAANPPGMRSKRNERLMAAMPWLVLGYLAFFAWRFADERLYSDSGYYLARVVNDGAFRIEHGRWVLAVAQAIPLLGVKLGLPMKALIMLHSLSNVIWMGACLLIAQRMLRDRQAALAIAALHLIGLTHGLFCPVFELYYGADLLVLFIAVRRSTIVPEPWRLLAMISMVALIASCHAIGSMLLAAALVMERVWTNRRESIILVSAFVIVVAFRLLSVSDYEKDSASFILKARDPLAVAEAFSPAALSGLIAYALRHYADVLLMAIVASMALIRRRRRVEAPLFIGFLLLMHALISLKLPGWFHDRYREQVNFGVVAWVVIMLFADAKRSLHAHAGFTWLLAAALLYRMVGAERMAPHYTERTRLIEAGIEQARREGKSKGIIPTAFFGPQHHAIELLWSVPVESLLLSSKGGPAGTVSLITTEDIDLGRLQGETHRFIFRRWDVMDRGWLDEHWFREPEGEYSRLGSARSDPGSP